MNLPEDVFVYIICLYHWSAPSSQRSYFCFCFLRKSKKPKMLLSYVYCDTFYFFVRFVLTLHIFCLSSLYEMLMWNQQNYQYFETHAYAKQMMQTISRRTFMKANCTLTEPSATSVPSRTVFYQEEICMRPMPWPQISL